MTRRNSPPVQPASSRTARSSLPRPALAKAGDPIRDRSGTSGGPPEDGYGPERPSGKRAEGAETDRLYQHRNDYAELHDPRSPETIEHRQQDSLKRLERAGPFNPPRNAGFAPDHDKT